ncbi:hypothetical protein [Streptomyces sparsus]
MQGETRESPRGLYDRDNFFSALGGSPLAALIPPRDAANAAITFYLGVNLFTVLDTDRSRTDAVFAIARRLAPRAKLLTMRLPRRRNTTSR